MDWVQLVDRWNENERDDVKITRNINLQPPQTPTVTAVPCRICQEMFGKVTLTIHFCPNCGRAFCNGVHGRFHPAAAGATSCVLCCLGNGWR